MIVFRLSKLKFSSDLSGKGAEIYGGRWNNEGTAMIYTSASRALCTIEIIVHTPLGNIPINHSLISIEIPDYIPIYELEIQKLSANWKSLHHSNATKQIGDNFINENKYLVMKVPSVVVQGEFNYLINPRHPDMNKVKIAGMEPFNFDERLFLR